MLCRKELALALAIWLCACCGAAAQKAVRALHAFGLNSDFEDRGLLRSPTKLNEQQRREISKLIAEGGFYRLQINSADAGGHEVMAAVRAVSRPVGRARAVQCTTNVINVIRSNGKYERNAYAYSIGYRWLNYERLHTALNRSTHTYAQLIRLMCYDSAICTRQALKKILPFTWLR